jgi:tetratricopeptide (TPR) repeat protein
MIRRALLIAATLVSASCSRTETIRTEPVRAIILISVDTLRSDRLPAYGYKAIQTPNIDALRKDSVLFERAYAHIPLTLPSHATMFTGLLPADTGLRDNAGFKLRDDVPTVASLLKERGFQTAAAVSAYSLRASSGIGRGFDVWNDQLEQRDRGQVMGEVQRAGSATIAVAKQWIAANSGKPFFYFLHLYEPHTPYAAPEPFRSQVPNAYDAEVAYTDALLGDFMTFLREQKLYDDALIIFTSDHGEGLNDHGEEEHGILLYREAVQVPLFVKHPRGVRAGTSVAVPVQLIDLFPTMLSLAGVDRPVSSSEAVSLTDTPASDRVIFSETYFPRLHLGWSEQHSIIRADRHLLGGTTVELYDPVADSGEKTNLAESDRRARAALLAEIPKYARVADPTVAIAPEEAKKLQALGYIGSAAASGAGPLPDPKVEIERFRDVRNALGLYQQGRYAEAVAATEPLLATNGRMFDVWDIRARSLAALGRTAEALEAARRAVELFPGDPGLLLLIAQQFLALGQFDEAASHARLALPGKTADAHEMLARIALARGDVAGAFAEIAGAESVSGPSPSTEWLRGRVALSQENHAEALRHFDRAIALVGTSAPIADLHGDRGFVLAVMGRSREAEAAFKEELRLFPNSKTARENLQILLRQK